MKHSVRWQDVVSLAGRRAGAISVGLALVLASMVVAPASAQAQTYKEKTLHKFTGGSDGGYPEAPLILDAKGNLYGTTTSGGAYGAGNVFKVDPSGHETVLYSFTGGADGASPYYSGVIVDSKGNFYGTTFQGGLYSDGVVFKVDPSGTETVLYSFTGGADGGEPVSGVIMDAKGNLYGTTALGGASDDGVVFKLDPSGTETVLYTFPGGADGNSPRSPLIMDAKGNLYSTTFEGGLYNLGVVFKISSKGKETVLHSFSGSDGGYPLGGVIMDAKGNLYSTTFEGGLYNLGVVFKISSKSKETVLHSFTGGTDSKNPEGGVIMDAKGNLYGTTYGTESAIPGFGVVFKMSSKGEETVLYRFKSKTGIAGSMAGLVFDAKGNLYGTSLNNGYGTGTVFKLTPN